VWYAYTPEEYGMGISVRNTKTMVMVTAKSDHIQTTITVQNMELEQVTEFHYLGSIITEDGRCSKEIQQRIAKLTGKLSKDLKKRMVKVLVWSMALYASET